MIRLIAIIILCLGLAGCGGSAHDARLSRIADSLDANPHGALAALDSIEASQLSEADRHYYDLLTVKSRDKAYVTHASDSLILSVMQYYEHHDTDHYPEALYYGGRVYSDLGDFPTALRYFQDALSVTPDDNLDLLGRLYSQTGRLLNTLRIYKPATIYVKRALDVYNRTNDTINCYYNNQLLGAIYSHREMLDSAIFHFDKAMSLSTNKNDSSLIVAYLAQINHDNNNNQKALFYIRKATDNYDPLDKNYIYSAAAKIYNKAGMPDSAFKYAAAIVNGDFSEDKTVGYYILLKQNQRKLIPSDSLDAYYNGYLKTLETQYNEHDAQSTLIQNSLYNYNLHERNAIKLTQTNIKLTFIILISLVACIILIALYYVYKYKTSKRIIKLQESLNELERISYRTICEKSNIEAYDTINTSGLSIKDQFVTKFNDLKKKHPKAKKLQLSLEAKKFYTNIENRSEKNGIVCVRDWTIIENIVNDLYPNFKASLYRLSVSRLTDDDYRLALLIKAGFSPTQIAFLLSKTPTTISYRRKSLLKKLVPEEPDVRTLNLVISLI